MLSKIHVFVDSTGFCFLGFEKYFRRIYAPNSKTCFRRGKIRSFVCIFTHSGLGSLAAFPGEHSALSSESFPTFVCGCHAYNLRLGSPSCRLAIDVVPMPQPFASWLLSRSSSCCRILPPAKCRCCPVMGAFRRSSSVPRVPPSAVCQTTYRGCVGSVLKFSPLFHRLAEDNSIAKHGGTAKRRRWCQPAKYQAEVYRLVEKVPSGR